MRNKQNELYSNKSNLMIQNYAWDLKEKQLKIMELLCSCYLTGYYDSDTNSIMIGIADFMREVGATTKGVSAKEYREFEDTLKKLSDTSTMGIGFNGNRRLIRLINSFEVIEGTAKIRCFMSEDYRECMKLQDRGNTKIEFKTICSMDSRYTIKLYNLLRSWQGRTEVVFDLDYLKWILGVTAKSYDIYGNFKQTILEVAVNEINQKTSIHVSYAEVKSDIGKSKKITRVKFHIQGRAADVQATTTEIIPTSDTVLDAIISDELQEHAHIKKNIVAMILNDGNLCSNLNVEKVLSELENCHWISAIPNNLDSSVFNQMLREYVVAQYNYAKAHTNSINSRGFLKYFLCAIKDNYADIPEYNSDQSFESIAKAPEQKSFETEDFFMAALKNSMGEDFDPSLLKK